MFFFFGGGAGVVEDLNFSRKKSVLYFQEKKHIFEEKCHISKIKNNIIILYIENMYFCEILFYILLVGSL